MTGSKVQGDAEKKVEGAVAKEADKIAAKADAKPEKQDPKVEPGKVLKDAAPTSAQADVKPKTDENQKIKKPEDDTPKHVDEQKVDKLFTKK